MSGKIDIITFSRRKKPIDDSNKKSVKKLEQAPRKKDSIECPEAASDYEKLQVNDGKGCKPGKNPRWRRDNPAAYIINYRILDENSLSYVKEQFAQIDGFSLVTETPTPPRRPKIANSVNFLHKYSLLFSQRVSEGVTSVMDSLKRSPQVSREGCMDALIMSSQIDKNAFNKGLVGRTPLHDSIPEHMVDPCPAHLKPNKPILDAESTNEHRITDSFEKDGVEIPGLDKENQVHNDQDETLKGEALPVPVTQIVQNLEKLTIKSALEKLLELCNQKIDKNSIPTMESMIQKYVNLNSIQKIGEGTFGEVFKSDGMVIKVVPMEGSTLINGEPQKMAKDLLAETMVAMTVSKLRSEEAAAGLIDTTSAVRSENVTKGFVETHEVKICRGKYAKALSLAWHAWKTEQGSENEDVNKFSSKQLFTTFIIADGGIDLEHFPVSRFADLQSILFQVVMALSIAEEACEFEHRDLHWGNILVTREQEEKLQYRFRGIDIDAQTLGLRVTLIDFSLSRARMPSGEVAFCDLNSDPLLFEGPAGNIQAEAYRSMKSVTEGQWQNFAPVTNVIWLRYLIEMLMAHKMPENCSRRDRALLRNFRKELSDATSASDVIWSDLFHGLWSSLTPNVSNG